MEVEGDGYGPNPYISMEWLNNIISSWYRVNDNQVQEMVKSVLEKELNALTPDIIERITLEECTFGSDTPEIKGIKTRVVEMPCIMKGKQQKVVMDVIVGLDSPDFEFKLAVKVPLTTLRASINRISFLGNLRVTMLFTDQAAFPGIGNICITFTDRPQLGFNVELLDTINIDAFGVDKLIADAVEDILSNQLVYPGRLYVDLSKLGVEGGKPEVVMMPRQTDQHPGVVTTKVTVSRLHHTTDATKVEVSTKLGKDEERRTIQITTNEQVMAHNYLIDDFDTQDLVVRAWESRMIFKDIQYGAVKVDLADMEFALPSVTESFSNEEKNVKVTVEVKAYLLPLIAIKQDKAVVTDYQSVFSGAACNLNYDFNTGVVYVHVHRATGIPSTDSSSKADPFVTVYHSENEVMKTKEVSNSDSPIFNEYTEFITEAYGGSKLIFKLDDADVWPNKDDPIGTYELVLGKENTRMVNQGLVLESNRKDSKDAVTLYVSVVFRSLPLV